MQLKISPNHIHLELSHTARERSKPVPTQGAHNDPRVLQLGTGSNKPVIPSPHWPPTANLQLMIPWSHRHNCGSIPINIMPTIVIDFPHFEDDSGPPSHILSHIVYIERVLDCGDSIVGLGLECLEFGIARHVFPVLAFDHLHLHVEWWLLCFRDIQDGFNAAADVEFWAFECRHI